MQKEKKKGLNVKIIYNKTDVESAIKAHLEKQGMNLDGKKVSTERVKDLIHVSIDEHDPFAEEQKEEGSILDDE